MKAGARIGLLAVLLACGVALIAVLHRARVQPPLESTFTSAFLARERLRKSDHVNPLADIPDLERAVDAAGSRIERIRYYTPLVGGFVENILVRAGEHWLAKRAARREAAAGRANDGNDAAREARASAKARVGRKGAAYATLRAVTWVMKLDLLLFGRVRTGPYFALLQKVDRGSRRP